MIKRFLFIDVRLIAVAFLIGLLWLMPDTPVVGRQDTTPPVSIVPSATNDGRTGSGPGTKPTLTPPPNIQETVNAIAGATDTAIAIASFTRTPDVNTLVAATFAQRATNTARAILAATQPLTPTPTGASNNAITTNAQWTPIIEPFQGVDMVKVPSACFTMGVRATTARICFDKPFWIDRYEVTNMQFIRLGGQAALPGKWKVDKRPREQITWFEARAFCVKRGARLPTEAEWEYAARGPDNLMFPWGNTFVAFNTVFAGNADAPGEVGSRPGGVSWVGAHDLSGNVWEWTSSLLRPYPYNRTDGREDPDNARNERVIRGGSWFVPADSVSVVMRVGDLPGVAAADVGFRCVRDS
ncbi:MAG: formylglycine-generating enzyme family protein [Anaerolineae bacterium]|nr:formylglycine-generating enzyme family protein [Anaerolineae bacterium]